MLAERGEFVGTLAPFDSPHVYDGLKVHKHVQCLSDEPRQEELGEREWQRGALKQQI